VHIIFIYKTQLLLYTRDTGAKFRRRSAVYVHQQSI